MKIRYLKLKDWLLMSVMGLLGVVGCNSTKGAAKQTEPAALPEKEPDSIRVSPRGDAAVMYGVPTMDFVLKGRVIDEKGAPVKGMQVVLVNRTVDITPDNMQEDNPFVKDYLRQVADTTDSQGSFECHVKDVPVDMQRVIVRDIDGAANRHFDDQLIEVNFADAVQSGTRKGWYAGIRTKDVDITVKER